MTKAAKKQGRPKQEIRQADIADAIGISGSHYSMLIRNVAAMGVPTAKKIGLYLNLDYWQVFRLSGDEIEKKALKQYRKNLKQ